MLRATSRSFAKLNKQTKSVEATGQYDYWLLAVVAMLLLLGTVMVYSASFRVPDDVLDDTSSYYLWRHLLWLGLGLAGMSVVMRVDYHYWRRFSIAGMVLVLVLLLAVLVLPSQFAPSVAGARRWLNVVGSSWQLQPSELAKLALILYAAHWLSSKGDKVRNFYYGLMPFALTLGILVALIMGEPDLGTSLIIGAIGLIMFFVAGANILHLLAGLSLATGSFMLLALTAAYRLDRFKAYFNPFADPNNGNYHIRQALMGLGSGGIFGRGLGMSQQKFFWLPTVNTDSIFAVIGEELGLVGAEFGSDFVFDVCVAWFQDCLSRARRFWSFDWGGHHDLYCGPGFPQHCRHHQHRAVYGRAVAFYQLRWLVPDGYTDCVGFAIKRITSDRTRPASVGVRRNAPFGA